MNECHCLFGYMDEAGEGVSWKGGGIGSPSLTKHCMDRTGSSSKALARPLKSFKNFHENFSLSTLISIFD